MPSGRVPGARHADAERSRAAILTAAAGLLARAPAIDMRRLAAAAQVSRSTLYRHFPSAEAVEAAVAERGLAAGHAAVRQVLATERPPLAQLRDLVAALVAAGAAHGLASAAELPRPSLEALAADVLAFVDRVASLAGFDPKPPDAWTALAVAHAAETGLRAAGPGDDAVATAARLLGALTGPLDQGLVVLDPAGRLLAANGQALDALGLDGRPRGEAVITPSVPVFYDDGSRSPSDAYPLARAVLSGEAQPPTVRGHRSADGTLRWFEVRADPLRHGADASPYGILAVLADVTAERDAERARLPAPGTLGRKDPVVLDVARVLDAVPAQLLPDQIVAEARRLVEVPVALYVVDIDGTHLLRLAGTDDFPARLEAPLALGPELAVDGLPDLEARLARELPGVVMAPLWLRGRAVGLLLAFRGRQDVLAEVARQAAPAVELANGYTDVFDAVRRRKDMNPAGEMQQSMLPPRIARLSGGHVAGGVLPSYDTGGDWFDYVENRDGAWLAIADAAGRGVRAAALGSVALAALRASRRNERSLEGTMVSIHETMIDAGTDESFLTALVARWSPVYASFSWINAGHPPPLLLHASGEVEELTGEVALPLGLGDKERTFRRSFRALGTGDRVVLYTDGVSNRPVGDGRFGSEGVAAAARDAGDVSASAIARAVQERVVAASDQPLRDDAAVVVLAPSES